MNDYGRAASDAQVSGARLHGDKAGGAPARGAPVVAVGAIGPTAPAPAALAQDQGVPTVVFATPSDVGGYVGPSKAAPAPQGKADAQQGYAQSQGK